MRQPVPPIPSYYIIIRVGGGTYDLTLSMQEVDPRKGATHLTTY